MPHVHFSNLSELQLEFVVSLLSNETGAGPPQPRDHAAVRKLHLAR